MKAINWFYPHTDGGKALYFPGTKNQQALLELNSNPRPLPHFRVAILLLDHSDYPVDIVTWSVQCLKCIWFDPTAQLHLDLIKCDTLYPSHALAMQVGTHASPKCARLLPCVRLFYEWHFQMKFVYLFQNNTEGQRPLTRCLVALEMRALNGKGLTDFKETPPLVEVGGQ